MKLISRKTVKLQKRGSYSRSIGVFFVLASGLALVPGMSGAQVDNRRQAGDSYIRGAPSGSVYGDHRDARPGYRPGERVRSDRNVDEVRPGYRPGAYGTDGSDCQPDAGDCERGVYR